MKNFLFPVFILLSYFSTGQQLEATQINEPAKVEKQQISKESKINKRVKIVRTKEEEVPQKVQEPIKKD